MTSVQIQQYRKHRRNGISAVRSWDMARHPADRNIPPGFESQFGLRYDKATWKQDGFTVTARLRQDEYYDLSYLGEWTDEWTPDVIKARPAQRGEYKYFLPTNTEASHYKGLRDMKYGRAEARELARSYVRQDYERARTAGDEWVYMTVEVTVSRRGVELGHAAVGGIESDSGAEYFRETAADLATEAIAEAKETLATLCASEGDA